MSPGADWRIVKSWSARHRWRQAASLPPAVGIDPTNRPASKTRNARPAPVREPFPILMNLLPAFRRHIPAVLLTTLFGAGEPATVVFRVTCASTVRQISWGFKSFNSSCNAQRFVACMQSTMSTIIRTTAAFQPAWHRIPWRMVYGSKRFSQEGSSNYSRQLAGNEVGARRGGLLSLPRTGPHGRESIRHRARGLSPWDGIGRAAKHPHHTHGNRQRSQLPRQLLGLQQRGQRNPHGQSITRWLPSKGFPHDQGRRTDKDVRGSTVGRIAPPLANRPYRPFTVPRSDSRI